MGDAKQAPDAVFVIMPFSGTCPERTEQYWTDHYEKFLAPLIRECGDVSVSRSQPIRGDLVRDIVSKLVTSPVVVADLTDANPNVYWELGVRQSFKHGTVTIAQDGTRLPFDVGRKGTHFYYPMNHLLNEGFRAGFKAAVRDCLAKPHESDSHVLESLGGRGSLFQLFKEDEAKRRLAAMSSELAGNKVKFAGIQKLLKSNEQAKKDGKPRPCFALRFRRAAAQFLVTARYVEADDEFYEVMESYVDDLLAWNDQLVAWEHAVDTTEKWLRASSVEFERTLNHTEAQLAAVRKAE